METLLIVGLLATLGGAFPAGASISPAERCAASQLKAVGKLASTSLACHAATATTLHPPQPCITAAMTAFGKAWNAAETKGGCITTASVTDAETEVGGVVAAAVTELTGTPEGALLTTPAGQACAARKLKATAKDAKAQFACDATGAKQAMLFSPACVNKAGGALLKAWDAAEAKGGCATQGDSQQLNLSGLSGWGVRNLDPATPVPCGTFVTAWGMGTGNGQFNGPDDVAADGSGNVFVADAENNRIQKFDNTGKFITAWGSTGSGESQFILPFYIAVDGSGNVFVSDNGNNRIQKFDNSGTFLLTFGWGVKDGAAAFEICMSGCEAGLPGNGNGEFSDVGSVAVDGSGNIFTAEPNTSNRIQKFSNTGAFLATWGSSGSGAGQFHGCYGVAVDGNGNVYVVDANNHRVQKFDNSGTFLLTFGWGVQDGAATFETCTSACQAGLPGSGTGQFTFPVDIAVDGSGNTFVLDGVRIQKFDHSEIFLTAWGSRGDGNGQFNGPTGIAVDGSGNVFVADFVSNDIQKFSNTGTFLTTWGSPTAAEFNAPEGITVDGSGDVFVTDNIDDVVQKFSNNGTFLTAWGAYGTGPGQLFAVHGVAVDGSGNVFVSDSGNDRIEKFDNSGTFLIDWSLPGPPQDFPTCTTVDGSGHVFVTNVNGDYVQEFTNSGTFLTAWGTPGSGNGQFEEPEGVAVDGSGNVFVSDSGNDRIEKFGNSGTFLTAWGGSGSGAGQFNDPEGVAVDGSGNVFVADLGNSRIQVFTNTGTLLTTWGSKGSGNGQFNFYGAFDGASGGADIAVDGSGNILVIDTGNERIEKFACPIPPPPPTLCGVVNGDPGAGTATCGGPCPLDFPFCAWVPGTVTGACRCVDNPCPVGVVGAVCSGNLCPIQSQTCTTSGGGCACQ
jgi:streptogramin lyase